MQLLQWALDLDKKSGWLAAYLKIIISVLSSKVTVIVRRVISVILPRFIGGRTTPYSLFSSRVNFWGRRPGPAFRDLPGAPDLPLTPAILPAKQAAKKSVPVGFFGFGLVSFPQIIDLHIAIRVTRFGGFDGTDSRQVANIFGVVTNKIEQITKLHGRFLSLNELIINLDFDYTIKQNDLSSPFPVSFQRVFLW